MTTDNFFKHWKKFSYENRQKSLDRLKADKDNRWSGDTLENVNNLVDKMEKYQSK